MPDDPGDLRKFAGLKNGNVSATERPRPLPIYCATHKRIC